MNHRDNSNIENVLREVTSDTMDLMQADGWYAPGDDEPRYDRPLPWDVNNGYCEDWAEHAIRVFGEGESIFLEDYGYSDIAHVVLKLRGMYYDAQHPDGVKNLDDLSIVKRLPR